MGAISGGLEKIGIKKQFLLHSPLQLKLWLVPKNVAGGWEILVSINSPQASAALKIKGDDCMLDVLNACSPLSLHLPTATPSTEFSISWSMRDTRLIWKSSNYFV